MFTRVYKPEKIDDFQSNIDKYLPKFLIQWNKFIENIGGNPDNFNKTYIDKQTNSVHKEFSEEKWYRRGDIIDYLEDKFK